MRYAALVAPVISRVFIAGMRSGGADGRDLVASYGGRAVGYLIDLRNPFAAGRALTRADLAHVYRYHEPAEIDETVARSVEHGLLARTADGALTPTERGRAFLRDLSALHASRLEQRWGPTSGQIGLTPNGERVARLNDLLLRVLAEAATTGGAAWAVQAPPHEPDGTPAPVVLLNRLSTLRYHRADAHAAAWQEAGLTAAEMVAMPWGSEWTPQRQAVESDTNARAAAPFAVLTPEERLTLLADLAALS
jgi:hypothetical protein